MEIKVDNAYIDRVTEVVNLLARSFPDHDIAVKQKANKIVIKIYQKKPAPQASIEPAV